MITYPAGTAINLSIALPNDSTGTPVVPLGINWTLTDEANRLVIQTTAVEGPFISPIIIPIAAASNALRQDIYVGLSPNLSNQTVGARVLEMVIATANGAYIVRSTYLLQDTGNDALQLLVNSFQSLVQAELNAVSIPGIAPVWNVTSDADKVAAMTEAYLRIIKFGFYVRWPRDPDAQNIVTWFNDRNEVIVPRLWYVMSIDRFLNWYPEDFRVALRRAQIIEAVHILAPNKILEMRLAGVTATGVGETRTTFSNVRPLDIGLSRATLKVLANYIDPRFTTTRS